MRFFGARNLAVLLCAAFFAGTVASAQAQGSNPDQKPPEQQKNQPGGDAGKAEAEKKRNVIDEAARKLTGPAANPECTWLGTRVVRLLSQDDLDTAFRHLDLYDRFGCPGNHIQAAFRCLARQNDLNPKASETLTNRVYDCWVVPAGASPAQAGAPASPTQAGTPPTPPGQGGTTTR